MSRRCLQKSQGVGQGPAEPESIARERYGYRSTIAQAYDVRRVAHRR
jgi:hypothetical protein